MEKNKNIDAYPNVKLILWLSFAVSVLLQFAMLISSYLGYGGNSPDSIRNSVKPPFHLDGFILNIAHSFLIAFLLFYFCKFLQEKITDKRKRILCIVFGIIFNTIVLSLILTSLHPFILRLIRDIPPLKISLFPYYRNLLCDFFMAVVVGFSWELFSISNKRQKVMLENERLISENHVARYEMLKNQINPHFLFNSLNTLQSLIKIDQNKAEDYVQELSKVLRYTLQDNDVVTLDQEVKLTNSYCSLMQIRYGKNLNINFEIDERLLQYEIMPLSLQILIENAIKHNVVSDKRPLSVNVISDYKNAKIIVSNKIQPKNDAHTSNGIGLANLAERYRLKWNSDIEIRKDEENFCVVVKLNKVK